MKYKYTGKDEKHFPDLEQILKPGETSKETDKKLNHPELELVEEDKKPKK